VPYQLCHLPNVLARRTTLLGMATAHTLGGFIHVLLVGVIIVLFLRTEARRGATPNYASPLHPQRKRRGIPGGRGPI
jgi:hypothetical protein